MSSTPDAPKMKKGNAIGFSRPQTCQSQLEDLETKDDGSLEPETRNAIASPIPESKTEVTLESINAQAVLQNQPQNPHAEEEDGSIILEALDGLFEDLEDRVNDLRASLLGDEDS